MKKIQWKDEGDFRVTARTEYGEYVVVYDDGLWGFIFPNETGYRGFSTFGGAKEKCEEHFKREVDRRGECAGLKNQKSWFDSKASHQLAP